MTTRPDRWRIWLAAAIALCLAGSGLLPSLASPSAVPGPGLTDIEPASTGQLMPPSQSLPAATVVRGVEDTARRPRRSADLTGRADGLGGQVQPPTSAAGLPWAKPEPRRPAPNPPGEREGVSAAALDGVAGRFAWQAVARPSGPGWRRLLESQWQDSLAVLTELSLSYHAAAERLPAGADVADSVGAQRLRQLMTKAVMARRALADTEDALDRLSAGSFGRCEQCAAAIPADQLSRTPESRYCARCAWPMPQPGEPAATVVPAA